MQVNSQTAAGIPRISAGSASEYDHYLLIDRSGSMGDPSTRYPGKTKWNEAEEIAKGLANYLATGNNGQPIDEDGFTLLSFSGQVTNHGNFKDGVAVQKLFADVFPSGGTDTAAALRLADELRRKAGKPAFFHVYTDGSPSDPEAVKQVIRAAAASLKSDADLSISIVQIGNDSGAGAFLRDLDDNLNAKFDVVNCMTAAEAELLDFAQIMYLAQND